MILASKVKPPYSKSMGQTPLKGVIYSVFLNKARIEIVE